MIPGWLFPILAALPSALLVWGSICLLVLLAMGAGLATHFLLISAPSLLDRWRHVPMAVLRTATALLGMGTGALAAAVANLVLTRRLRSMDAYDARDFCGRGIPRKDWAVFLDKMADLLWEMQGSGRREP